jgi:hypothetical protein
MAFWYSLWSFGIFLTFWYVWTKKKGNPAQALTSTKPASAPLIAKLNYG